MPLQLFACAPPPKRRASLAVIEVSRRQRVTDLKPSRRPRRNINLHTFSVVNLINVLQYKINVMTLVDWNYSSSISHTH